MARRWRYRSSHCVPQKLPQKQRFSAFGRRKWLKDEHFAQLNTVVCLNIRLRLYYCDFSSRGGFIQQRGHTTIKHEKRAGTDDFNMINAIFLSHNVLLQAIQ